MRFRVLGPVEAEAGGQTVPLPRRRERCLLGVLLLHLGRAVSTDRLSELLWDGEPPARARPALHSHVSRLRTTLQAVELRTVADGYRLDADPAAVDVWQFRALLDQATRTPDLVGRVPLLRSALGLWRGPALAGAASQWLRERLCTDLTEARLLATEDLLASQLTLRQEREILPELAALSAEHPGRENLTGLHMRALYQAGRRAEALDAYDRARAYLADQLGLDPGPALRELHQAILRDQLPVPAPPSTTNVVATRTTLPPPQQLPPDVAGFTGRARDLDRLDAVLPTGTASPATPIVAISGTAGVGKTTLAIHWGHRTRGRFPDGQLYANLQGFGPGEPVPVSQVVRDFLDALQVPPHRTPSSPDAQVGLYRSLLASKRVLVVLDNAATTEQVRPLLPAAPGCLVLVTSRHGLSGLAVNPGAYLLDLDLLPPDEAYALLSTRLGADRLAADRAGTAQLLDRCGGLPLALAIVAARAVTQPDLPLAGLATELASGPGGESGLSGLSGGGDVDSDLRAVLSWSYRPLRPDAARLFRLLSLHPGPHVAPTAAASLAGLPLLDAQRLLAELTAVHLLTEPAPDRYALHDLLRTYASELLRDTDPEAQQQAARHRLLDHYLRTALVAVALLAPHRQPLAPAPAQPGAIPAVPLSDGVQAMTWFAAEHRVLNTLVCHAAETGLTTHCWQLAWALAVYLESHGLWREQLATAHTALYAARTAADLTGQAHTHRVIGRAHIRLGQSDPARHHLHQALARFQAAGDLGGQALTHANHAMLAQWQGQHRDALSHARQAVQIYRRTGHRAGEATALDNLTWALIGLGHYRLALAFGAQALAAHPDQQRNLFGQASAWHALGRAHQQLGENQAAVDCFRHAADRYREAEARPDQASVLADLGEAYQALGDHTAARATWQQELAILVELDRPGQ